MKISLNWLNDYVKFGIPAEKLAHRLTMAGLEVEKISQVNGDTVFELEITPNRPDCLNVLGIARETSAALNRTLKYPQSVKFTLPSAKLEIHIDDKKDCGRYIGTLVEGVDVSASPAWLARRVETVGCRSINNVVDVTNFCLLELGQPLHAFDFDKLIGGKIVVRRAKQGESIVTIDGVERKLDPGILVIADAKRPVAIAGIMGGKDTEVDEKTKNVLLESASFDPVLIRRAGRKLGLSSDSSYRFERGVDIDGVSKGSHRAIGLILKEAGGKLKKYADIFPGKAKAVRPVITVDIKNVNNFLGANISLKQGATILKKLDFKVSVQKNTLKVTAPSFRNDIKQDVDVVEEIARIVGYDNLPSSYPIIKITDMVSGAGWSVKKRVRENLLAQGLDEVITYTMTNREALAKSGIREEGIKIQNPLTKDQEVLRPSLLPGFLAVVASNINRGQKNLRLFEIGRTYETLPEKEKIGILLTGNRTDDWRTSGKSQVDYYDLKGVVEELCAASFPAAKEKISDALYKIPQDVLSNWDIKQKDVYFAELDLNIFIDEIKTKRYQPVIEFPPVVRDVSMAVKKEIPFEKIQTIACRLGGNILQSVNFIEQYLGEKIPAGQKGLVFSLVYQSPERTLREEEVSQVHEKICQAIISDLGAVRR